MTEKQKSFVYKYWNKTELGRAMIASSSVSDNDLLFLIPNNVKKMHGLPVTRITGKKKRKNRDQKKRHILSFKLFDLLEEIIDKTIISTWSQNDFFDKFVDIKNLAIDNKNKFEPFDESKIVTMKTSTKPIKIYLESN